MRKRAAKKDRQIIARDLRRRLDSCRVELSQERDQRLAAEHNAEESLRLADEQEKHLGERLSVERSESSEISKQLRQVEDRLASEQRTARESKELSDKTAAAYKIQASMRKRAAEKDRQIIARDLRNRLETCRVELLVERKQRVAAEHDAASAHHKVAESYSAAEIQRTKSEMSSEKIVAAYKIQASVRKRSANKDKKIIAREMRRRLKEDHLSLMGKISRLTRDKDDAERALTVSRSKQAQYMEDAKKADRKKDQMLQDLKEMSAAQAAKQNKTTPANRASGNITSIHKRACFEAVTKEVGTSLGHQDRLRQGLALGVAFTFFLVVFFTLLARHAFVSEQCTLECAGADIPHGI
jgi:hypothetical protein